MFTSFASRVDLTYAHLTHRVPFLKTSIRPASLDTEKLEALASHGNAYSSVVTVFQAKDGRSTLLSMVYAGAFATKVIKAIAGHTEGDRQGTGLLSERHWSDECLVRSQSDRLLVDQTFLIAE